MNLRFKAPSEGVRMEPPEQAAYVDGRDEAKAAHAGEPALCLRAGEPADRAFRAAAERGMRRETCTLRLEGEGGALQALVQLAVRAYFHGAYRFSREAVRARLAVEAGRAGDGARIVSDEGGDCGGSLRAAGEGLYAGIDGFADFGAAQLALDCDADVTDAARRGWLFALCESRARTLGNLPANLLGADALVQVVAFLVVSVACLALFRPIALKYRRRGAQEEPTLVGQRVVVCEDIDNGRMAGRVRTGDDVTWAARSSDGRPIPAGEGAVVVAQESVKLIVEKA